MKTIGNIIIALFVFIIVVFAFKEILGAIETAIALATPFFFIYVIYMVIQDNKRRQAQEEYFRQKEKENESQGK